MGYFSPELLDWTQILINISLLLRCDILLLLKHFRWDGIIWNVFENVYLFFEIFQFHFHDFFMYFDLEYDIFLSISYNFAGLMELIVGNGHDTFIVLNLSHDFGHRLFGDSIFWCVSILYLLFIIFWCFSLSHSVYFHWPEI